MVRKVQMFSEENRMLEKRDRLVAGISGGADSVCLLLILRKLSREVGFSFTAVYVEHGIRGKESMEDASFVRDLCGSLDVPFLFFSVDAQGCCRTSGQTLEEAARELRYGCFFQACRSTRANKIAVAHHANDSAETVLFHLARGTGIRGMRGIRPVTKREMPGEGRDSVLLIRPLLCVTREEIEAWLRSRGQDYRTDSTNGDLSCSRNRIRSEVIPQLAQVNTQAVAHIRRTSEQLSEISDYLDEAARQAGEGACEVTEREDGSRAVRVFAEPYADIHPFLQRHLLHLLLGIPSGSRRDITSLHVERTQRLMTMEVGRKLSLPGRLVAEKVYNGLLLYPESIGVISEKSDLFRAVDLRVPGETIWGDGSVLRAKVFDLELLSADSSPLCEESADARSDNNILQNFPKKRYTKWFDYDKIKDIVQIRARLPGDYLQIDMAGGHKKLRDYFIDEKIPRLERGRVCLLADGSHIMWVVGHRISGAYKLTEKTKRVLCVAFSEKEERVPGGGE